MTDKMDVDVDESKNKTPEMKKSDPDSGAKKSLKRKRASQVEPLTAEERVARVNALREELDGLFKFYKEVQDQKVNLDSGECSSSNSAIACLLEESSLSLSTLVNEIFEKMKAREGTSGSASALTVSSVKSSVLFIAQRFPYGVPNADADVLEDESESCLWCWETRDIKLFAKSMRAALKNRRTCRKKIHERISVVSEMITVLQNLENNPNYGYYLTKAAERLGKVLGEADIRILLQSMEQKDGAVIANKESKREEKQLIRQLERNKREAEKEKRRLEQELKKEKWQSEKELKRLQDEAEKEGRRRKKEESELRKQLRKQQEEAEKDQRRREKEKAEMKQQLSLRKQASIMERFLKRSKSSSMCQDDQSSIKSTLSDSSLSTSGTMFESVTLSMDCALSSKDDVNVEDIWKSHLNSWHGMGLAIRSNKKQHWGMRKRPKTEIVKELKLTTNRGMNRDDELTIENLVDGWNETKADGRLCNTNADSSISGSLRRHRRKQLLQFAKCYRPAFYGIWPKESQVIGPRHPFKKDPDLDYDIDSDEEWEEEEPGESLSDCDKDDEEECLEEGYSKADDEEDSEDGFFVPDGYLSENEGVQVDRKESDCLYEEGKSLPGCKQELEGEDTCVLLRQQKYLHKLTENALRKNQPLVISNLMHEKASSFMNEELTGTQKLDHMCLLALSMCVFPGGASIEISLDNDVREEDQDTCTAISKDCTTPVATTSAILDSDLPQIVSAIQSCPQGINKVVQSLQQKFPSVPKLVLRNKVREISDFVDNRWQVKKIILDKLGLTISPEKGGGRKSIASFFSKRCLPPAGNDKAINPTQTSPESSQKPPKTVEPQKDNTNNNQ